MHTLLHLLLKLGTCSYTMSILLHSVTSTNLYAIRRWSRNGQLSFFLGTQPLLIDTSSRVSIYGRTNIQINEGTFNHIGDVYECEIALDDFSIENVSTTVTAPRECQENDTYFIWLAVCRSKYFHFYEDVFIWSPLFSSIQLHLIHRHRL